MIVGNGRRGGCVVVTATCRVKVGNDSMNRQTRADPSADPDRVIVCDIDTQVAPFDLWTFADRGGDTPIEDWMCSQAEGMSLGQEGATPFAAELWRPMVIRPYSPSRIGVGSLNRNGSRISESHCQALPDRCDPPP